MQCDKCGNEAIIFQPYSGRHLCREHLVADIETRIKREIRAGHWMRPGDHLAVALSGNKSSRALLFFFHTLIAQRRDIRLSAIIIDEGIAGYRTLHQIRKLADVLDIPCYHGSFQDEFQLTIDVLAGGRDAGSSCNRCRELRTALVETIARREHITRIISGRTLEDKAGAILENLLIGEVESLIADDIRESSIPWVDPLGSVPRTEAGIYADLRCPGVDISGCPYRGSGFSEEVGELLESYTNRHPATPFSIAGVGKALREGCGHVRAPPPASPEDHSSQSPHRH